MNSLPLHLDTILGTQEISWRHKNKKDGMLSVHHVDNVVVYLGDLSGPAVNLCSDSSRDR